MSPRVAFVTTHPIQYQAPIFRILAQRPEIDFKVLFCQIPNQKMQGDGFGVAFEWDVPLLEGYQYEVLNNVAREPSVTRYDGCDTPEIRETLRAGRYDAVIVNGWVVKSCLQTLKACRTLGVPCLVRGEANVMRPRAWWKRFLHSWLIRKYSAYLYIGSSNREFYTRHGARENQLFPSLYCVENDRFALEATEEGRQEIRTRFGIGAEEVCFLYSGKFIEKKHPLELVKAFAAATDDGCEGHLLMVGDGPLKNECETIAREGKLKVHFAGFVNQRQMPQMYAATDCLVLPSDHGETWGLVVNEAMACGRAAIVSNQVGCSSDLIGEHGTGMVFPLGDWNSLANALREYSRSPLELRRMGEAARVRVSSFSPEAAAQGIVNAVDFVISAKRRNGTG